MPLADWSISLRRMVRGTELRYSIRGWLRTPLYNVARSAFRLHTGFRKSLTVTLETHTIFDAGRSRTVDGSGRGGAVDPLTDSNSYVRLIAPFLCGGLENSRCSAAKPSFSSRFSRRFKYASTSSRVRL
jgi:hypothetical protein